MAVGTTADHNLTREELITLALGMLGETEPSESSLALGRQILGSFTRHLDLKGNWFWAIDQTETSLTLVSGQSEYGTGATSTTLATNIFRLNWIGKIETNEDRIPLSILSEATSSSTFLKGDTNSEPVAVYLDRAVLLTDNVLHVYPTPNAAYELRYTYRRPIFDFDNATDNPDIPTEMLLCLQYGLAYHLAPHFGIALTERQIFKQEYELLLRDFQAYRPNKETNFVTKTEYF